MRPPGPPSGVFILAETLLGNFAGLTLGFLLVFVTLFFLALACVGGFTLVAVTDARLARRRASSSAILRSSASRTRKSASA